MRVQVKQLLYWKTEHGSKENCQDASQHKAEQGLFAVADGAGTSLFPALWARILAEHFVTTPLMSDDCFEIEWWVRLAQVEYKQKMPNINKDAYNVMQKVHTLGSDSTLATLRVTNVDTDTAKATLLVFGDSCILIGDRTQQTVSPFVLQRATDFDRAPICVPSDLKFFNRDFHRCELKDVTITTDSQIILATDAVSRWIIGRGDQVAIWDAFRRVYQCSDFDTWRDLIDSLRQPNKEIVNDDSTVLILTFYADNDSVVPQDDVVRLGYTTGHSQDILAQRKQAFEQAIKDDNKEVLAIAYGDGKDFENLETNPPLNTIDIAKARNVAHAFKEVLRSFRQYQNSPALTQKMTPIWQQYQDILTDEPCAANLIDTLRKNGIIRPVPATTDTSKPAAIPSTTHVAPAPKSPVTDTPASPLAPQPPSPIAATSSFPTDIKKRLSELTISPDGTIIGKKKTPSPQPIAIPQTGPVPETLRIKEEINRPEEENDRLKRAVEFWQALALASYNNDERKEILVAYDKIESFKDKETIQSIPYEIQQDINKLKSSTFAQKNFYEVLKSSHPIKIAQAYLLLQQNNTEPFSLPPQGQAIVDLSQAFAEAWQSNDSYWLGKIIHRMKQSTFGQKLLSILEEEQSKIKLACDLAHEWDDDMESTIVLKVDGYPFRLKDFITFFIINSIHILYLQSQLPTTSPDDMAEHTRILNKLQQERDYEHFLWLLLERMINYHLILQKINTLVASDSTLEPRIEGEEESLANNLYDFEGQHPDSQFRRYDLGRKELKLFAHSIVVFKHLASHFERQEGSLIRSPKKVTLDQWLKGEKENKKYNIFFGTGNVDNYAQGESHAVRDKIHKWLNAYIKKYIDSIQN